MEENSGRNARSMMADTLGFSMVVLLVIEYIVGMYTTIFIEIPEDVNAWSFAFGSAMILVHIALGVALMAIAIVLLVLSIKAKKTTWTFFSGLGLAAILISLMFGAAFMNGQNDMNAFIMAVGLGIAIFSYAAGVYFSALASKKAT